MSVCCYEVVTIILKRNVVDDARNMFVSFQLMMVSFVFSYLCVWQRSDLDAESFLMDELCEDQGLPQVERPIYDVKSAGLCTEDEEYITKIQEFQAYLDLVEFKPGFSLSFSVFI